MNTDELTYEQAKCKKQALRYLEQARQYIWRNQWFLAKCRTQDCEILLRAIDPSFDGSWRDHGEYPGAEQ